MREEPQARKRETRNPLEFWFVERRGRGVLSRIQRQILPRDRGRGRGNTSKSLPRPIPSHKKHVQPLRVTNSYKKKATLR